MLGAAHHLRLSWVGIAQKKPHFALANAQEQCPPYKQAPLIFGLPQPLDAPYYCLDTIIKVIQVRSRSFILQSLPGKHDSKLAKQRQRQPDTKSLSAGSHEFYSTYWYDTAEIVKIRSVYFSAAEVYRVRIIIFSKT